MIRVLPTLGVLAVAAGTSTAQIVGDFDFSNLSAEFQSTSPNGGVMEIVADGDSSGSVTSLFGGTDYAVFAEGFAVTFGPANFSATLDITLDTPTTATATGSFTVTDINGNTLSGQISGEWLLFGSAAFFTADLSGVSYSNPGGTFDGGADALVAPGGTFIGALQFISIDSIFTSTFFTSSFQNAVVTAQAQFIPSPGGFALAAAGLAVAARRRR